MFNCFGVEHIPKEIKIFVDDKNAIPSVCKMKAYDSMIWGYFCIGFIDFLLNNEGLLDSTSLFLLNGFLKNDTVI